ncbi:MAG: hypothetical protein ACKOXO_11660 [Cyanobium sp.]
MLLGVTLLLGAAGAGWWLGRQQQQAQAPGQVRSARLEREVRDLRRRFDRGQASPAEQQRLLELLIALDRQQQAIALLEPLADREPDRWALRLMLAELRRDRGDRAGAERELRMILNRRSDQLEALQLMTLLQLEQGRGSVAEARVRVAYRKALGPPLQPHALGLGLLLAELQQKRGQSRAAVATYRQLADTFAEDQRPLLGLTLLRHQLGDSRGALAALNQARLRSREPLRPDPLLDRLAASLGLEPLRSAAGAESAGSTRSPAPSVQAPEAPSPPAAEAGAGSPPAASAAP